MSRVFLLYLGSSRIFFSNRDELVHRLFWLSIWLFLFLNDVIKITWPWSFSTCFTFLVCEEMPGLEPLVPLESRYPELVNEIGEPIGAISQPEIFTIKVEVCFDSHFQFLNGIFRCNLGLESMFYNDK